MDAEQAEVDWLKKRYMKHVLNKGKIEKNANVLGGRFPLTPKHFGFFDEGAKVLYVARGYNHHDKPTVVDDVIARLFSLTRVVLSIAADLALQIFPQNVNQTYLQITIKLSWKICIHAKKKNIATFIFLKTNN